MDSMNIAGYYKRVGSADRSELWIEASGETPTRYHVSGLAYWGEKRASGPNIGTLDFDADLDGNRILHSESYDVDHLITLTFDGDVIEVSERNAVGVYGVKVTFAGKYERVISR
ncbi:hypothetical protein [Mesorhizobium sp. WSM4904]|uniref:hypothetical protein n=1 Tax=Mesorhizobium sp. WSM4904 TaxID=3038545 RepID=UPI00241818AF|nr:hypothetical protein [Mesorhizobium sp. WSM4904]WFP61353.1 hypothetical protein QAZ47_23085 [Mesorhizobium sp. WSM4904]